MPKLKFNIPGWKIMPAMPCLALIIPWPWRSMVMIMPWWRHGGHICWHGRHNSWHDRGMIKVFSTIYTMIMVGLSCLPQFFLKNGFFLNFFSKICRHRSLNTATWRHALEEITPLKCRICDIERVSFLLRYPYSMFLFSNSFNIIYITAFSVFFLVFLNFWAKVLTY